MGKAIAAAVGMLILILDSQTALAGASEGLTLCLQTVIPSLFPFFLLSDLLTGSLQNQSFPGASAICKLWKIPCGSQSLLFTGLLGGYPVGARCVSQAYERGSISRSDAARMTLFCNACGPAFLFGIGSDILGSGVRCLLAWLIIILSAWITAIILPGQPEQIGHFRRKRPVSLIDSLNRSIKSMASVCAWVVLFRIALSFLERWLLAPLPDHLRITILGFMELANGCVALKEIPQMGLRFLLFVVMTGFGGLCVTMQTMSAISPQIPRHTYFPGKLFQGCTCIVLAWIVQLFFPDAIRSPLIAVISLAFAALLAIFLRKSVNNSSISAPVGV